MRRMKTAIARDLTNHLGVQDASRIESATQAVLVSLLSPTEEMKSAGAMAYPDMAFTPREAELVFRAMIDVELS